MSHIIVLIISLTIKDGAIALAGGRCNKIPDSFSVTGQLQCEMKALSKYIT